MDRRITEAAKLGFATIILPACCTVQEQPRFGRVSFVPCDSISEALNAGLGSSSLQGSSLPAAALQAAPDTLLQAAPAAPINAGPQAERAALADSAASSSLSSKSRLIIPLPAASSSRGEARPRFARTSEQCSRGLTCTAQLVLLQSGHVTFAPI